MSKILIAFVFLGFLALFFSGILVVSEPIKLVPYDLIFPVLGFAVMLTLLTKQRMYFPMGLRQAIVLGFGLLTWHSLQALISPDVPRAITLLGIVTRDVCTMVLFAIVVANYRQIMKAINYAFFAAAVLASLIALPIFVLAISDPARIVSEPHPGLIYRAGEGLVPHFQGFTHNPIYFATLSMLSAIVGLSISVGSGLEQIFIRAGLVVLLVAGLSTFQRGALVALILGLVLMVWIFLLYSKPRRMLAIIMSRALLVTLLVVPVLIFVRLPNYEGTLFERIAFRFYKAKWELRYNRWSQVLLPDVFERPLVGHGLRAAELKLGALVAENAYLEILYDQGIIGLVVWGVLFAYVLVVGIKKVEADATLVPWVLGWIMVLLSLFYVSMQYDPLTWIVAGIIIGSSGVSFVRGRGIEGRLG